MSKEIKEKWSVKIENGMICIVTNKPDSWNTVIATMIPTEEHEKEALRRAKLMASAPEILQELQKIVDTYIDHTYDEGIEDARKLVERVTNYIEE